MTSVRDFRDLKVWHRAIDFAVEIYRLTIAFPREERFGMTAQLRRAAVSVSSNIAEGSSRTTLKDRRNFYGMARSSLKEAESLMLLSQGLDFIRKVDSDRAMALATETGRMLTKLRQNLRRRA